MHIIIIAKPKKSFLLKVLQFPISAMCNINFILSNKWYVESFCKLNFSKKIRGHAIFWAVPDRNPEWLKKITNKEQFYKICMNRATDIVSRYKGRWGGQYKL